MTAEEQSAARLRRLLDEALSGSGAEVSAAGAGVHWHVTARLGVRSCRVSCFHSAREQRDELLVTFLSGDDARATGRTGDLTSVRSAVSDWLVGAAEVTRLRERHGFVDARRRELEAVVRSLNAALAASNHAVELDDGEFAELWAYGGERSCRIDVEKGRCKLTLFLHRTSLATTNAMSPQDAARIIAAWFASESQRSLRSRGVSFVSFATEFERGDVSAWHWGSLLADATNDELLASTLKLIERIAADPSLRRFFPFTSHATLRFSRSSHYPFDLDGLPFVNPLRDSSGEARYALRNGGFFEGRPPEFVGTAAEVFPVLAQQLKADAWPSYVGCLDDLLPGLINPVLEARGSALRAHKNQRREWLEVRVTAEDGRWCRLSLVSRFPAPRVCVDFRDQRTPQPYSLDELGEVLIAWAGNQLPR